MLHNASESSVTPVVQMLELRFREDQHWPEVTQPESGTAGITSQEVWFQTQVFIIYKDFVDQEFR